MDKPLTKRLAAAKDKGAAPELRESPSAGCLAQKLIERHEGYLKFPKGTASRPCVIGYGSDLSVRGLSELEAAILVARDVAKIELSLSALPYWNSLGPARQAALIDLAYNVGIAGFLELRHMLAHLAAKAYEAAADAMLTSLWASQVGDRVREDATIVRTGRVAEQEEVA